MPTDKELEPIAEKGIQAFWNAIEKDLFQYMGSGDAPPEFVDRMEREAREWIKSVIRWNS